MNAFHATIFLTAVSLFAGVCTAAPTPTPPPATTAPAPVEGPKNDQGLTAAIIVNKDSYVLNPAQSGKAFRDKINAVKNAHGAGALGPLPNPPAVDLTFRITNATAKDIIINAGGDDSQMKLILDGPGAISADNLIPMTMEFRVGKPLTIAAGQSTEIKITSLAYGMRGISNFTYWTEPGQYTLTAEFTYSIEEQQHTVTSGPATLKVTK